MRTPIPNTSVDALVYIANERKASHIEPLTLEKVLDDVCIALNKDKAKILSKDRKRTVVVGRHIYAYVARLLTTNTVKEIGQFISRDHTSILHAIQTVKDLLDSRDGDFEESWFIYTTN